MHRIPLMLYILSRNVEKVLCILFCVCYNHVLAVHLQGCLPHVELERQNRWSTMMKGRLAARVNGRAWGEGGVREREGGGEAKLWGEEVRGGGLVRSRRRRPPDSRCERARGGVCARAWEWVRRVRRGALEALTCRLCRYGLRFCWKPSVCGGTWWELLEERTIEKCSAQCRSDMLMECWVNSVVLKPTEA